MKITIICDVLGDANNGTSVAAYNLINHLKSQGHDVTVVCCDADKKGEKGFRIVRRWPGMKSCRRRLTPRYLKKRSKAQTSYIF